MNWFYNILLCTLVLFLGVINVQALNCYIDGPQGQRINYTFTEPNLVCTAYKYKCVSGDTSCTAEEITQGTIKTSFTVVKQDSCTQMKNTPSIYMNTFCCSTDLCNVAPATQLTCWQSMNRELIKYTFTEPNLVCTTYKYKCVSGDTACTAEEITRGAIKTSFTAVSQDSCTKMKNMPSIYMNTFCCSTDLCNTAPAPSLNNGFKTVISFTNVLVILSILGFML